MSGIQTGFEQHMKDLKFYELNYQELLAQYPDQWIAIVDQKVVGASEDAFELVTQLKRRGISGQRVLTRHLTEDPELLILTSL